MKEGQLNLLHLPLFTVLEYATEYAENPLQDYLVQRVISSPRMPCSLGKNSYVPLHTIRDGIETLEIERRRLIKAKELLEEEVENDIGTLDEELIKLKNGWADYNFKKRRALLNFAAQEVKINKVSTHWLEIQVLWLHEEWGHERIYYRRHLGAMKDWTDEESKIVAENYETMLITELMALLPERTMYSIRWYAKNNLGLSKRKRHGNALGFSPHDSHSDREFKKSKDIPDNVYYTNWEALY